MAFNPFNIIRAEKPTQNKFDLSFDNKLTFDMGKLYPVLNQECFPGDSFTITPSMLVRFAPMIFPVMHRMDAFIHFFYVPHRINWENFPKFLARENYAMPYIQGPVDTLNVFNGTFLDYLGLPPSEAYSIEEKINAMSILSYYRIYNEYFQDQNNDSDYIAHRDLLIALSKKNGLLTADDFASSIPDVYNFQIVKRAWEQDYFTGALPFAQKGPAVTIPLSLEQLVGDVVSLQVKNYDDSAPASGTMMADNATSLMTDITPEFIKILGTTTIDGAGAELAGTINQLRASIALQKFYEKNARGGGRYPELIKAHFDEDIGDARVNRPEYLGCIKNNVVISEVLQTSQTSVDATLGEYAGHGTAVVSGNTIKYRCPEHGTIMAILSVIPRTAYFQGINRKFTRLACEDYFPAEFAHIGEQAILNKELYYNSALADNNDVFGYIPRFSELKYNASEVHGDFRWSMRAFTLARIFAARPNLNQEFIYMEDDKRIFAVTEEDTNSLYAHIYYDIKANRKIPFFSEPAGL